MSRPGLHRASPAEGRWWRPADIRSALGTVGVVLAVVAVTGAALFIVLSGATEEPASPPGLDVARPSEIPAAERESEVVVAATEVLTAWSARELGYGRWWARLRPLLTPGGRQAYAFTDPSRIPVLGEVEATRILRGRSGRTATVYFDTGKGRFGVDVSRRDARSPWLAHRILFPGQKSVFA